MKTMTIGKKIALTCGALVGFTVLLASISLLGFRTMTTNSTHLQAESIPGQYLSGKVMAQAIAVRVKMNAELLDMSVEAGKDAARVQAELDKAEAAFLESLRSYDKTIKQSKDRELFGKIEPAYERFIQAWNRVRSSARSMKPAEVFALYKAEALPAFDELQRATEAVVDFNNKDATDVALDAVKAAGTATFWNWVVALLAGICGTVLAIFTTRSMNRSLHRAATELAEGAEQVASAAAQVSSSSQSLAQGSSEQAASLEETSASSEEINSMARKNTENSRSAADLVTQSQQKFVETNRSLEQMVVAMAEINTSSDKISKIIKVIDEIAFQTNILALNAAVEAARAGEAGMGFAVVADEVRNLAQRCAQAAKDTAALIEESISKSNDGKLKVDQVAGAIRAITDEAAKIKTLVDEVNLGSQEQARGIDQIGKAINEMEKVTQKTAASAEESASAAEELTAQSSTLKEIVGRLNTLVGSAHSDGNSRRTASAIRRIGKPQIHHDSVRSLAALRAAVVHQPASPALETTGVGAAKAGAGNDFPLDEDFKEF
jgi:methyl-accepting chemotaxis protein